MVLLQLPTDTELNKVKPVDAQKEWAHWQVANVAFPIAAGFIAGARLVPVTIGMVLTLSFIVAVFAANLYGAIKFKPWHKVYVITIVLNLLGTGLTGGYSLITSLDQIPFFVKAYYQLYIHW